MTNQKAPALSTNERTEATINQQAADLTAWLQERGLLIEVVAIGRSGVPAPIVDFMPDTHRAVYILRPTEGRDHAANNPS